MIEERLAGYERYVARCLTDWKVPGAAIGMVRGDRPVYTLVKGSRDAERGLPVTEQTLFEIGSTTKAFTAAALGILVDEGQLAWDTPVCTYVPSFQLIDPAVGREVTLRDLLTHRTGLPRHDQVHMGETATRQELLARLRYLEMSAPFRTTFQYSNLAYIVAGAILEQVAGMPWESFIRTRLFTPLKMTQSTFLTEDFPPDADVARGHQKKADACQPAPLTAPIMQQGGPAGSISANVLDMCRWIAFQLGNGRNGRKVILQAPTLRALHAPQIIRSSWLPPAKEFITPAYAMGWQVIAYRGHLWVGHNGATSGFTAHVSFLPHEKFGVVVLTNGSSYLLPLMLALNAYDRLLDLDPLPWNVRWKRAARKHEMTPIGKGEKHPGSKKTHIPPTHPPATYAGEYLHPGYGQLVVQYSRKQLLLRFHGTTYRLKHQEADRYDMLSSGDARYTAAFSTGADGACTLAIPFEPAVAAIVFERTSLRTEDCAPGC